MLGTILFLLYLLVGLAVTCAFWSGRGPRAWRAEDRAALVLGLLAWPVVVAAWLVAGRPSE